MGPTSRKQERCNRAVELCTDLDVRKMSVGSSRFSLTENLRKCVRCAAAATPRSPRRQRCARRGRDSAQHTYRRSGTPNPSIPMSEHGVVLGRILSKLRPAGFFPLSLCDVHFVLGPYLHTQETHKASFHVWFVQRLQPVQQGTAKGKVLHPHGLCPCGALEGVSVDGLLRDVMWPGAFP